jgi:acetyl esterase/lipase
VGVSLLKVLEIIMIVLAYILSGLTLLMSGLLLFKFKTLNMALFVKLAAGALSPYLAIIGVAGAVLGWVYQAVWAIPMGIIGTWIMIWYVLGCIRGHMDFENAFGADWSDQIRPEQTKHMVKKRWMWFLKMKASPEPSWERDIPFWTIPATERELLCDIWSPAGGNVSGLAFVYLHSSGWFVGDKNFGTKPFFRHLVDQGHTVMDVAYRLCPEVDIYGMIGDVKRAVAWMKTNASRYGVSPAKIVLGGGSAGAHLALLAGYAPEHPGLTPDDVLDADLSVCGIISYYGPSDLLVGYDPWIKANPNKNLPPLPIGKKLDSNMAGMRYAGRMDILLGGVPQDIPDTYHLASPTNHVRQGSPPTLLIQGDKDLLVAMDTTRALHKKLVESGVPAINAVLPWTDHAFDLILPQISPPAQSALYDVDRFLALLVTKIKVQPTPSVKHRVD